MNNSKDETMRDALLYGWRTKNESMYYGFPIVTPNDNENFYNEQSMGRMDLVPPHILWSNLSETEKDNMNNLLEVIRNWWEFPRWISTILFSFLILLAIFISPENDQITFIFVCLVGGIVILVSTVIESIIITSLYIKNVALGFPIIIWIISLISIIGSIIIASLNSYYVSILIAFVWWVIVYFINTITRIIVWRIRRNLFLSKN